MTRTVRMKFTFFAYEPYLGPWPVMDTYPRLPLQWRLWDAEAVPEGDHNDQD